MARILIIDDDSALLDALSMTFEGAGYDVSCAEDGDAGLTRITSDQPDAVVCDVNMPGLDGFSLCRKVRQDGNMVPFLILTSRDSEIDEALGLDLGADDYISKPFSTRILLARVQALLRRQGARDTAREDARLVRAGALEVDPDRLEVRYAGAPMACTLTEIRLLQALAERPGIVLSRDRLLDLVRPDDSVVGERLIDTYIRRLRRKLEAIESSFDRIETVIGAGYRWKTDAA